MSVPTNLSSLLQDGKVLVSFEVAGGLWLLYHSPVCILQAELHEDIYPLALLCRQVPQAPSLLPLYVSEMFVHASWCKDTKKADLNKTG